VDYVIPGNDDAIRAIRLYAAAAADAVIEGASQRDVAHATGDDEFVEVKDEPARIKVVAKKKTADGAVTEETEVVAAPKPKRAAKPKGKGGGAPRKAGGE